MSPIAYSERDGVRRAAVRIAGGRMRVRFVAWVWLLVGVCPLLIGQGSRRLAIMEANGSAARGNPGIAAMEARVSDDLNAKLAGQPGITLIDRASVDKLIKEQNFQNSDRSDANTAARIGKLLGVSQVVLVNVYDASYSTHQDGSNGSSKTTGTMVLRANARLIDVETAVILAQPKSEFQDSVVVGETSKSQGFNFGAIRVPAKQKSSGGDPKVIQDNETAKAVDSVTTDLATQFKAVIASAPKPKAAPALVAGIANGSVFINEGAGSGIKAGDHFQVTRTVSVGLTDPTTGQPIVRKQKICVLTISDVEDTNASGTCAGGLPQSKDVAEPME
ncbi:CsgG/HfaB family protein [Silvibacterium sp.]|uniref:CsgG/HfaB family protein n=1 Tax=Silvibacterium sp. TaxID=1964179 RepID=UPI0039E21A98